MKWLRHGIAQLRGLQAYFHWKQIDFWLAWKLLFSRQVLFGGSAPLALIGLSLGVACLIVSMSVFSGFESSLRQAMADVTGHVRIVKNSRPLDNWKVLEDRIRSEEPTFVSSTRFLTLEAVLAHQGKINGVMVQGVDRDRVHEVLDFRQRLVRGEIDLKPLHENSPSRVLIGKSLAEKMNLNPGDFFRVVYPVSDPYNPGAFKRRMAEFVVAGILDLGKYEWNERFILADLEATQKLSEVGDRYTGLILKFQELEEARKAGFRLNRKLGPDYWIRDWRDSNENLFDAVKYEKPVIFFVVFIIVIVAALNIASTLYVNVVRRYSDIAILKTLGLESVDILKVFSLQGLMIGGVGLFLGTLLGLLLGLLFTWGQSQWGLIPGEVYKMDSIHLEFRWMDYLAIVVATLGICFLATWAPSRKGSQLPPVEGLKYG